MLPVVGLTDHVTPAPEGRFSTENCSVREGATLAVAGVTLVGAGGGGEARRVRLAAPRTACVEAFLAVTVKVCCEATLPGARYKPACVMLPLAGLTAQLTLVPEGTFCAENCWV